MLFGTDGIRGVAGTPPLDAGTVSRIGKLIQRLFGVRYHDHHVWWLLGRMGWSCQKPARQAKQRDEAAIERWRKVEWPATKRGLCAKAR
jgi:transposase